MNFSSLTISTILDLGKNILSTVSINYALIFGLGLTLNAILILLIALVWPSTKTILKNQRLADDDDFSYRRVQKRRGLPWKRIFLIIGLLFLLAGICLLSSSIILG